MRRAAAVARIGIVTGITAALGLTRFLRGLLFEVSPTDPLTLATMAALFAIALFAVWIPARRVARTEPLVVLRLDLRAGFRGPELHVRNQPDGPNAAVYLRGMSVTHGRTPTAPPCAGSRRAHQPALRSSTPLYDPAHSWRMS